MPRPARALLALAVGVALAATAVAVTVPAQAAPAAPGVPAATTPSGTPICPDPGPAPTGVTAAASLVYPQSVQVRLTWTPLNAPASCRTVVEIQQVTPAGPTITAPAGDGQITISGLAAMTAYTWRIRYVGGTVSAWATVTSQPVIVLDNCLGLPTARPIVSSALSPTSVHLEWGALNYPVICSGTVTVKNAATGATAATTAASATGVTITGLTPGTTTTWVVSFMIELGRVTVTQPVANGATCTASAKVESSWRDGFTATITVRNTSTVATTGWSARWPLPAGVRIDNVWSAVQDPTSTSAVFVAHNATWNGSLAPGATALFGLLAARAGDGAVAVPVFTCTATA